MLRQLASTTARARGAKTFHSSAPAAMAIHENILGAIGNTPVVRINKLGPAGFAAIWHLSQINNTVDSTLVLRCVCLSW